MDTAPLFAGRDARAVSAVNCPRRPGWLVDGHLVRTSDGRHLPGGLVPADELTRLPAPEPPAQPVQTVVAGGGTAVVPPPAGTADATVIEFLRATRELVAAQRDVVLNYLGVPDRASAVSPVDPAAPMLPPASLPSSTLGHASSPALADQALLSATADDHAPPSATADHALLPATADQLRSPGWTAGHDDARVAAASARSVSRDPDVLLGAVVEVIVSATGYPAEMLEADLDLEADLGIDSIKRTEILGALAERIGLGAAGERGAGFAEGGGLVDEVVEELAAVRTIRGIVDWIVTRPDAGPATAADSVTAMDAGTGPADPASPFRRFVVEVVPLPSPGTLPDLLTNAGPGAHAGPGPLTGSRFAVVEGGLGIGLALTTLLEQQGAFVRMFSVDDDALADQLAGGVAADGVWWVSPVDRDAPPVLPAAFGPIKAAVSGGTRRLVIATGSGGSFGRVAGDDPGPSIGMAGLARTLAREAPDVVIRAVDLDPKEAPTRLAEYLLTEFLTPAAPPVTGYRHGVRSTLRVVPAELPRAGASPAAQDSGSLEGRRQRDDVSLALGVPTGSGVPGRSAKPIWQVREAPVSGALGELGRDCVVLLTGGARGITARVALGLARATGCGIELVGRTPLPVAAEDPATAAAVDAPALRSALIAAGLRRPAEIEARVARLLAEREVRATIAALSETASFVRYHAVDVRDAGALRAVVATIYAERGRIDGVVHGAGVCEDKLLRDKTPESFERVFSTKVDGARTLAGALRPDLGFLVLFGSVSGVFGNRGQVDYSAANDALDTCAHAWARRFRGRVVSLDWGPWGSSDPAGRGAGAGEGTGGGMVSAELERAYAQRGIGLIDPDAGVAAVLRELAAADVDDPQVVYMCGSPDAFDARA